MPPSYYILLGFVLGCIFGYLTRMNMEDKDK